MIKFSLVFQIIFFSASIYCQDANLYNNKDSLGRRIDLTIWYDTEDIKLYEAMRVNGEVEYTHYYTRKGDTISVYNWDMNVSSVLYQIRDHIYSNFMINEFTEITGTAYLFLILDFEREVYELRPFRKITEHFDKELLRVIKEIEKDMIVFPPADCKIPFVIPFGVSFNISDIIKHTESDRKQD